MDQFFQVYTPLRRVRKKMVRVASVESEPLSLSGALVDLLVIVKSN